MKEFKNQTDEILEYLQGGNTLTQLQALRKFGCMRLASRIGEIRKQGFKVISNRVVTENHKHVAQYRLDGVDVQMKTNL